MARRMIVDGYNLLRAFGRTFESRADALERGREELLRAMRALPASSADEITIVFDGRSGLGRGTRQTWGGIEARFSRGEGGADALILRILASERDRSRVVVISSDRELAAAARSLGARVIPSETYARTLAARREPRETRETRPREAAEKPPPPGRADVDRWEEEFRQKERDRERRDR